MNFLKKWYSSSSGKKGVTLCHQETALLSIVHKGVWRTPKSQDQPSASFLGSDLFARHLARAASPRTEDQASGRRARGGGGPAESGNRVHEAFFIFWDFLGMGGAPRLLLLSVFLLLLLAQTELASYQTSIAEEEIPEERAGDEEEPGEHKKFYGGGGRGG